MEDRIKELLKKISIALGNALSSSEEIKELVQQLKDNGYDLMLFAEIKVALSKEDAEDYALEKGLKEEDSKSKNNILSSNISTEDREFLRSIRIKIDE